MSSLLARTARRSAETASTFISQVIVSVAAAICVGLITNAYFQDAPPSPPVSHRTLVEAAAPASLEPGVAATSSQIAAQNGIGNDSETVWAPLPDTLLDHLSKESTVPTVARRPRPDAVVQVRPPAPAEPVAPPSHGTEIFPDAVTSTPLEPWLAPAPLEEQRPRLFGLRLPRLPRSPADIGKSVAAAKEKVLSLAPRLGRGDDLAMPSN